MRQQMTSFSLLVCGVIALTLSLAVAPTPLPAAAMPALQPSPRPTLEPTPDVIPDDDDDERTVLFGRVTGTVIDTRTSAPAPNKVVLVGDTVVMSDASGNYDRWVAPGRYSVGLQLGAGEGLAAQGMQPVEVAPDGATVLHLFFSSPEPIVVDVAPKTDAPTPVAEPTPAPTAPPVAAAVGAPSSLPETSVSGMSMPGPLLLVGIVLLGLGALLQLRPRRHTKLHAWSNPNARLTPEELLAELLRRDV